MVKITNQAVAAEQFAEYWKDKGYEKGECQPFWLSLLSKVFGVEEPEKFIEFEDQVHLDHTSFIDGFIPHTHVLIEQKGLGKDLEKPIKQSDGSFLTPFQQAKRYASELPYSRRPRWIVTCNFAEFHVYDMEHPNGEPEKIYLKDLKKEFHRLGFLIETENQHIKRETEVSLKAGELVGKIYDLLLLQYKNPENPEALKSLNKLCVRLVFCLYAEDAGIFEHHNAFHDYLVHFDASHTRKALIELFRVLDTKIEDRDPYLEEDLAVFPYVNGGLFADEDIEIPQITEEIRTLLLENASEGFDWSDISPTIFGAVFESTLNPETRRNGGMHYTSIENIHKVIEPLFLDGLKQELESIQQITVFRQRKQKAEAFQEKLARLKFLDPACGSGNFLTETYLSLRRLENEAIKLIYRGQSMMGEFIDPVKVSIHQFYGIEINDFAVSVAKTALWIAESQMLAETSRIVQYDIDFLPLKYYTHIIEGNALRIDWNRVVSNMEVNYIMGNPPFVGARKMEQGGEQKADVKFIFGDIKDVQDLDYVACWYKKAVEYIQGTSIEVALVSTNSICQGAQVPILWGELLKYRMYINFAYQTFRWDSEATAKAIVHCIIVGFASVEWKEKFIVSGNGMRKHVANISPYLLEGNNLFVMARKNPLCDVPKMNFGNQPRDGGHLIVNADEIEEIVNSQDTAKNWLRRYVGADELIKGKKRWCFWLKKATPADITGSKILMKRVEAVRQMRLDSKGKTTNGYAKVPHLFAQITQPDDVDFLAIPCTSSERRKYVPIDFLDKSVVASNGIQIIPHATLYHFGVLTSNVHMAWMRLVGGRMKSDYRYSKEIVYNTFPWPHPTEGQLNKIKSTAQAILDARSLYPDCSLADLYNEVTMPVELRKAHQQNDRAVMEAYGFSVKDTTETSCVETLMKMYQRLVHLDEGD